MGGATNHLKTPGPESEGLSPRGRGNLLDMLGKNGYRRSIPAWAGQPKKKGRSPGRRRVYPRVGGATAPWACLGVAWGGLSPRGRGNLSIHRLPATYTRSIPAWAGQPLAFRRRRFKPTVYPRVGGATL